MTCKLPSVPHVECYTGPLKFDAAEGPMFDSVANEHLGIIGTDIEYFSLDVKGSVKDPLYNEAKTRAYKGPFKVKGFIEYPENAPEIREEGIRAVWNAQAWIPRRALEEAGCPVPNEGDVLRIWKTPFYDQGWAGGNDTHAIPGAMYAFDCVNINDDGHLFDNPNFVGYKIELRRRSEFTPERRIDTTR